MIWIKGKNTKNHTSWQENQYPEKKKDKNLSSCEPEKITQVGRKISIQKKSHKLAPLKTFIMTPILETWCLIIPILGTNKAQGFKLLRTKPSSNNFFT